MHHTGKNYLTKDSTQAKFLLNMVERVTSPLDHSTYNYEANNYYDKDDLFWHMSAIRSTVLRMPYFIRIFLYNNLGFILSLFGL